MRDLRLYKISNIFIVLFFFIISDVFSQKVNIYSEHLPAFQFNIDDIWNVTLTNSSSPVDVYLLGTIENSNSKLLVKLESSDFKLLPGTKRMNVNSVGPVDVDLYSNRIFKDIDGKRFLLNGIYSISVFVLSSESNTVLCTSSKEYEVLNIYQLGLISPLNGVTVKDRFPVFNWRPPATEFADMKITYELIIAEINEKQSPREAILLNSFTIKQNNIESVSFEYPNSEIELQNGKKYIWMVKALIDDNIFSESEIWEFEYNESFDNTVIIEKNFQAVKTKLPIEINSAEVLKINKTSQLTYSYTSKTDEMSNIADNKICIPTLNSNSLMKTAFQHDNFVSNKLKVFDRTQGISRLPFQFLSSYSIVNYQYSTQKFIGSELPRNYFSLRFDPTFVFFEIPLSFNSYINTTQNDSRQSINSFALRLEPRLLNSMINKKTRENKEVKGYLKYLSGFDALNIGEVYPSYSKYTINGSKLTGVDVEYNPGLFYLAFSGLYNYKAVEELSFSRKMLAGKIGLGDKRENHFHLTILKAWDDENSLNQDQITNGLTPQENFLVGTDGKLKLFNDKFVIEGEITGSVHTRNKTDAEVDDGMVPRFLRFIIKSKVSTSVDYMYIIKSTYDIEKTDTKLSGTFKSIGPGYVSLGALNFRNDIRGFKIKLDQRLFEKKIQFSASMEREGNNVGSFNSRTETTDNYGFNLRFNFKDFPYIILDYRPNTVTNNEEIDSLLYNSKSSVFTFMMGLNDFSENFYNSSSLLISTINSKSSNETSDYRILNFVLSDNLTFTKIPLSFAGSFGYSFNDAFSNSLLLSVDLSGTYTLFNKMNNTLGFSFTNERDLSHKIGYYFSTSVPLWELGELYLRAEQNLYREKVFEYGNRNDFIFTATISKSWEL
ncbi:hypothetical protein ACFLSV_00520 [Bacteroidota bacterium]